MRFQILTYTLIAAIGCTSETSTKPTLETKPVSRNTVVSQSASPAVARRCHLVEELTKAYEQISAAFDCIDSVDAIDDMAPTVTGLCVEVKSMLKQSAAFPKMTESQQIELNEVFANGLGATVDAALNKLAQSAVSAFQRVPDVERWAVVRAEFVSVSQSIQSYMPRLIEQSQ